jgi:hypothetical protein
VNWDWIKDIGWVGTTLVALGGLAATVWTSRRSGEVQLAVQNKQLEEGRRLLEWQERRAAYALFLKQFQEYFDKVTTQSQLNSLVEVALSEPPVWALVGADADAAATTRALAQHHEDVRDQMHDKFGLLTMRDEWALRTQVQDAANQASMIASPSVREGIDALIRAAAKESIEAAVKDDLVAELESAVRQEVRTLNDLMNRDLLLVPQP